ncbi:GNAT family N-acetyltransferase [Halobacteriales archaeon QS_4_62_28]|nr:MAG: GNAT family N-acetyltransferase [Halobacteriales archaeon QS_4_62_28]
MELETVTDHRGYVADLVDCYESHDWWAGRTADDIERAVEHSDVFVGLVDSTDRLVAGTRVLTDFVYYGKIYDIVVHEDVRDEAIARQLLDDVTGHRSLADVQTLYLTCEAELTDFYESCGFTEQEAASEMVTMGYDG